MSDPQKKSGGLLDMNHPFFRPIAVRVIVTAFALGWGAFEIYSGEPVWGTLFIAAGIYSCWALFLSPNRSFEEKESSPNENEPKA